MFASEQFAPVTRRSSGTFSPMPSPASRQSIGDGTLTALMILSRMAETGQDLKTLGSVMQRLPQVLVNVAGVDKDRARATLRHGVLEITVPLHRSQPVPATAL